MEATEHHHPGPSLDFNWGAYGAVAGEPLHPVHQDLIPSAAPPSLPLFTESHQHDGPQRTSSGQPDLNVRSRPRRQTKGSKRYRNEEFVSDPAEDDEEQRQTDSGLAKRHSSSTGGTNTPSASAAASASAGAIVAASAPPMQEADDPGHAVSIPSTQVVPYHQPSHMGPPTQPEAMHPNPGAEEALAYHHHEHHIPVSSSEQLAAAAAHHNVIQQDPAMLQDVSLQLDQELPVPVVPKLPPKQTEPLNGVAIQTLQSQDAASHDQYLKLLRFDDQVAELASRRGLLVRFVIKSVKTYQPQPEMIVEAPEFMTVEYLKRRIMKAKLLRGEFLNPMRFVMRKKGHNDSGEVVGMEDVPSREPTGDEIFLFHQGYEAPGPYELFIATAPQTTDREQQDRILGMTHQEAGGADPRLSYQQLLQAPGMAGGGQMAGMPGVSSTMQMGPHGEMQQPQSAGLGMEMQGVMDGQQMSLHSGMLTNGMPVVPAMPVGMDGQQPLYALPHMENEPGPTAMTEKSPKPRRQTGRWMPEEVEALIEGVSLYKTSWAQIYERYVVTNKINSKRTQVDLKDKWRNLVKLVTDPNKHARGMDLSEEQRQTILRLVFANDVTTADYGTNSADQAAAAGGEGHLGGEAALGDGQGLPVEAVPVPDISQADMAVLLQNMYAQYQQMGIPVPDAEVLQAQLQQHLQQQQFLQQHMSAEDVASMQVQAQQLQVLDQAMGLDHLQQMDPQQFAAYQHQIMAQQAQQHHHMMSGDMQQYQQVDASGSYHEHYPQQLEDVAGAEHMHGHHPQQQLDQQQGAGMDLHAQHHPDALDPETAAQLHAQQQQAHHQQQHVVDPLQPLTEETLDLPPLTAQ